MATKTIKKPAQSQRKEIEEIEKLLATAIRVPSEQDADWQENPFVAADSARESIATSKSEDRVLDLLADDLSEARRHFADAMGKKWDWHTDEYSIFQYERNSNYFEPRSAAWLECAKNAISHRFHALLQLRSRDVGLDPRESVRQTVELVLTIVHKQCWLNDAFRSISFMDRLPDGVPDRQASNKPVSSYLHHLLGLVCSHVERLRAEALTAIDLRPPAIDVALGKNVEPVPSPESKARKPKRFRSKLRVLIFANLIRKPDAEALWVAGELDDMDFDDDGRPQFCQGVRCFAEKYRKDVEFRDRFDIEVSKVRDSLPK